MSEDYDPTEQDRIETLHNMDKRLARIDERQIGLNDDLTEHVEEITKVQIKQQELLSAHDRKITHNRAMINIMTLGLGGALSAIAGKAMALFGGTPK